MSVRDIREVKCEKDGRDILGRLDTIRNEVLDGKVTGIMAIVEHGGTYTVYGSGCENSRSFAGALLELAVRRLGFAYRDE